MPDISIRLLYNLSAMQTAVDLQRVYWGESSESVIPAHMLFSIAQYGGHVLGAFDGERMVGVLTGLLGTDTDAASEDPVRASLLIYSKRMVVLPEYRGQGIGYRLKLAQREFALKRDIRLVTWTFDPLLAANAHLNLRKLGTVGAKYLIDLYGSDDASGLATLGASDRLRLDWWVAQARVESRVTGEYVPASLDEMMKNGAQLLNPTAPGDPFPYPNETPARPETADAPILLEVPLDYPAIVQADSGLARAWRDHSRYLFTALMRHGYRVMDFLRADEAGRGRGFYLLSQVDHRAADAD